MQADMLAPASVKESVRYLGTLPARPRLRWWLLTFLAFGIVIVSMVGSSTLLGRSIDQVGRPATFATMLIVVAAAMLIETAFRSYAGYLLQSRARMLSVNLRRACLSAALRAPIPEIAQLGTGNVITRLTKDIDTTIRVFQAIGVRLVLTVLMFPFTIAALVLIHWAYALVFFGVAALMYPAVQQVVHTMPEASNIVSSQEARRNNLLLDTIRGLPTIRALGWQQWAVRRIEQASWDAVAAHANRIPLITRLMGLGNLSFGALTLGCLVVSTWMSYYGYISVGEASAAVILVNRMEIHVFNVLFFAGEIQYAVTALGRAVALAQLNTAQSSPEPADCLDAPDVEVDTLSYAYPGGSPILSGLTLTFEAGTTTALVGASGAGKSTLAALIAGLQRPTAGAVRIGGVDTRAVPDTWTARQVSLISQHVHLFSGTLREDLRMAAPVDDAALYDALAAVGLHGAVFERWLPQGLDTRIGAGADELAPEVQQQIALARVILKDPPVLIMDEATSEAGSDNAVLLEQAATRVARGRTSLVVAHRLDQVMFADRIILMDDGRIVEDGTHEALLAAGGKYANLFERWQNPVQKEA
ncbi:ABC transporter ATP-binding protein [Corynebacterium sp.]|uniref:ABC transporter ATP-binding protein n=1 Tax=Corynebacterium sp. TaxID=1720 RepID=UPI0026DAC4E4|nr:ABC transporter ATP-binding protein [Corynebacterium sp.]MDO5077427.1 ABC transporter ATP-binding protein [Corynebacterium sp.]